MRVGIRVGVRVRVRVRATATATVDDRSRARATQEPSCTRMALWRSALALGVITR